ncbi:hypothetical protein DAETH_07830 [Deinococcus aetherius]|uniref:Nucleotidyltransferase domain-containing protein n=1 Tax=Deinococcus aetherius TaxID=200252 RepID=A0ABN6RG22_9DEIO|nr:hypothetical protein [Deinococcus aetherius]BDP40814.1 hypothetical protein DAETH_07830 [Deinococcus aetherius]
MLVFTPEERAELRETLIRAARADLDVTGLALTGSAALGREDRWSDIDLALGLALNADEGEVVARWTGRLYREHGAVWQGRVRYRVFLLADTLQVDLSFWPPGEFGATGPAFRLLFGTAVERPPGPALAASDLIGWAWLYARHVRSCLKRGRVWQAELMVSGMRAQVLSLACLQHGLPAHQGRGLDDLPPEVTGPFAATLVRSLEKAELERAFEATTALFLRELAQEDAALAGRLAEPLGLLIGQE